MPDLTKPLPLGRSLLTQGLTGLALFLTFLALLPLGSLLWEILARGVPALKWEMLTSLPAPMGDATAPNGFANALIGTMTMVTIATLISVPIGVLTAIYLSEFGKQRAIAQVIRFSVSILSAVPSIVIGVFAYAVIVFASKTFSAKAGGFALAVIMLPMIVLATEEALKRVPMHQRLGSAALGGNVLQTTLKIVVATAIPNITTGVLLAIARVAGETAPLIFTALFSQNWASQLDEPTASLSVMIYNYSNSAFPEQNTLAWSASVILVSLVFIINFASRWITSKRSSV